MPRSSLKPESRRLTESSFSRISLSVRRVMGLVRAVISTHYLESRCKTDRAADSMLCESRRRFHRRVLRRVRLIARSFLQQSSQMSLLCSSQIDTCSHMPRSRECCEYRSESSFQLLSSFDPKYIQAKHGRSAMSA